jgi:hypothetical protein
VTDRPLHQETLIDLSVIPASANGNDNPIFIVQADSHAGVSPENKRWFFFSFLFFCFFFVSLLRGHSNSVLVFFRLFKKLDVIYLSTVSSKATAQEDLEALAKSLFNHGPFPEESKGEEKKEDNEEKKSQSEENEENKENKETDQSTQGEKNQIIPFLSFLVFFFSFFLLIFQKLIHFFFFSFHSLRRKAQGPLFRLLSSSFEATRLGFITIKLLCDS